MKITFQRSGEVKSFESILTMEWFSGNRIDIVQLLTLIQENDGLASVDNLKKAMGSVPDYVVKGVITHLKDNGYLNPHGVLSPKGTKVIQTGKVPVEEKGQFKFYYIEDPLLNNHLLHFERGSQIKGEKQSYVDSSLYENKVYHSVTDSHEFRIKQFDGVSKAAYIQDNSGTYRLQWDIDLSRPIPSKMYISGNLTTPKSSKPLKFSNQEVSEEIKIDPHQLVSAIIQRVKSEDMIWDEDRGILLVPLKYVEERELEELTTSLKVPELKKDKGGRLGHFKETKISMIPIGPIDATESKKWIMALAKKFLKDGYKNSTELTTFLESLKEKLAFRSYEYVIDSLTIDEILNAIKQEDYQAYWNLQTPLDLFLELDERFIVRNKRLDLAAGTSFSMYELVDELVDNEVPDTLVFSSKFVRNSAQIRKFELFVKAFKEKGVQNILLVTNHKVNFKDKDIKVESYENVYNATIPPHDRYFAFKAEGKWHRYKMTAELDQCRYERQLEATEHTQGIWRDISFMEILPEVFPQKLNEQLSVMEEVYYV